MLEYRIKQKKSYLNEMKQGFLCVVSRNKHPRETGRQQLADKYLQIVNVQTLF